MNLTRASEYIKSQGYQIDDITFVPEGSSHDIFFFTSEGRNLVARFEKKGSHDFGGVRRDFHYNGLISLEREAFLCNLVRESANLPAPKIDGVFPSLEASFIVAQRMPGVPWNQFIQEKNYSKSDFIASMEFLAEDIAKAQQVVFASYGDIMPGGEIFPTGIQSFAQRLNSMVDLKLQREEQKGGATSSELDQIRSYFGKSISSLDDQLKSYHEKPVLVLADFHATNFLVDERGKPSGYFDLEFCQAGMPTLEFNMIQLQLLNYFDQNTFEEAKDIFFKTLQKAGSKYDPSAQVHSEVDKILSAGRMLTCVTAYHGVKDGLRDTWSERCKELIFEIIDHGKIDYASFADIMREKTKQPKSPSLP
ncbi:TPA: aminoglycoside phosphotransferase family protein [Candidatus Woesearchaeota archaeon]|nr:aminoglycoside phosphotransferase family protein [Candidatus Woesearchaeota archaeon]